MNERTGSLLRRTSTEHSLDGFEKAPHTDESASTTF